MVLYYYALKSETDLPKGAKFVDPYDNQTYTPLPIESLPQFITRVQSEREKKQAPSLPDSDLKTLINECFYQTTPEALRPQFFVQKSANPTIQQIISVAKALVTQLKAKTTVSLKQKRERAVNHCLNKCALHSTTKRWSPAAVNTINKAAGINEKSFPEEAKLGNCEMCGCNLKSKIGFSTEAAFASLNPGHLDKILKIYGANSFSKCWILKECEEDQQLVQILRKKLAAGHQHGNDHLNAFQTEKLEAKKRAPKSG